MVDRDTGWFAGDNGQIFKTVNGGTSATQVSGNPAKLTNPELRQNYPNPFNPSTNIMYYIPKESRVILKIFDMLGREILTLVNSIQQPGQHTVRFNAGPLPSGVYLYRIEAGNFSDTKKFLLLR
ncbi:MAG: T9SS type A sorting domain-containing protein, partial [Syntrophothermus sp.]